MLLANKELIANGKGIVTIPIEEKAEFGKILLYYYETNDMRDLFSFLYEKCLDGMNFKQESAEEERN